MPSSNSCETHAGRRPCIKPWCQGANSALSCLQLPQENNIQQAHCIHGIQLFPSSLPSSTPLTLHTHTVWLPCASCNWSCVHHTQKQTQQVRHIIYHKGLEGEFDIVSPAAFGGLGSDEYKALNPQNKMPLLLLPSGRALPESEVGSLWRETATSLRPTEVVSCLCQRQAIASAVCQADETQLTP